MDFSTALSGVQNQEFWKREVIKNNTVIIEYKNRLYNMDRDTGVRYPYSPTNADLRATDWYKVDKKKSKIKRNDKVILINSSIANCIFEDRSIETEGDIIIPINTLKSFITNAHIQGQMINEKDGKSSVAIKYTKLIIGDLLKIEERFFNDTVEQLPKSMHIEKESIISDTEKELTIDFGKNKLGLSYEFITIGNRINELSKKYSIYIIDSFIDEADDVYQLKFKLIQKK